MHSVIDHQSGTETTQRREAQSQYFNLEGFAAQFLSARQPVWDPLWLSEVSVLIFFFQEQELGQRMFPNVTVLGLKRKIPNLAHLKQHVLGLSFRAIQRMPSMELQLLSLGV